MNLLDEARHCLEPEHMDPDRAGELALAAAVAIPAAPAERAAALLVLHRARHIAGDEAGARDSALYALEVAHQHGLSAVAAQAGAALLRLYAGSLAHQPLLAGVRAAQTDCHGAAVVPPPAGPPDAMAPVAALARPPHR